MDNKREILRIKLWYIHFNLATIFFCPTIFVLSNVFDCRYNPINGNYLNQFDPVNIICWTRNHWIMVTLSYLFVSSFIFTVIYYAPNLQLIRGQFGFKDKEWILISEPFYKCILMLVYFNFDSITFLSISTAISFLMTIALFSFRSNKYIWFDYFRASFYTIFTLISACFLGFEIIVDPRDYDLRLKIDDLVTSFGSLLFATILLVSFAVIYSKNDRKKALSKGKDQTDLNLVLDFFSKLSANSYINLTLEKKSLILYLQVSVQLVESAENLLILEDKV